MPSTVRRWRRPGRERGDAGLERPWRLWETMETIPPLLLLLLSLPRKSDKSVKIGKNQLLRW